MTVSTGRTTPAALSVVVCALAAAGCDPEPGLAPPAEALTLRDLLGMDERSVAAMDAETRSFWRHRLDAALDVQAAEGDARPEAPAVVPAAPGVGLALPGPLRTALTVDAERDHEGKDPLVASEATGDGALHPLELDSLFEAPAGAGDGGFSAVRAALAANAPGEETILLEAPGAPFGVLWTRGEDGGGTAWVNPVLRALRERDASAARAPSVGPGGGGLAVPPPSPSAASRTGPASWWGDRNPYRFYASLSDCAAAEQARCAACLGGSSDQCTEKLGTGSGVAECEILSTAADGFLLACIMHAYSMATVEFCMDDAAPACAPPGLPYDIASLESYRPVLDDAVCYAALDTCLDPYRDDLSCNDPCDDFCNELVAACTEPCTSGIDACAATGDACGETATGCGDATSSTAGSCGDACGSGADACGSASDSCSSSCAVVRPLPPRPVDPARPAAARPRVAGALRNLAAFVLPLLVVLLWRRRLRPAPAAPAAGEEVRP